MSKKKIEKPRVFISYAWGSDDYQGKVLSFASQLMSDGIDVVLDKWDLSEGNDTYAFMEKCATDDTITNVLMLIDPIYAQKADAHAGGVGTETQIISAKVYQEVTQDKFIPIVFERNDEGEVCKPTYLMGRLHFDLSLADRYDYEYLRLVKTLYGEEVYQKPELGNKPAWVEEKTIVEVKKKNTYDSIKDVSPEKARRELFRRYLEEVAGNIRNEITNRESISIGYDEIFSICDKFRSYRRDYILLLENSIYISDSAKVIAKVLENFYAWTTEEQNVAVGLAKILLHELFLYSVAFFLKTEDYDGVGYLLRRAYYDPKHYRNDNNISGYEIFYSGREELLDRAIKDRDNKQYICGTAAYWIENIDIDYYTKEQIILADLICYNYSIYAKDNLLDWPWFPLTYIYDNRYNSALATVAKRMISKEYVDSIIPLFGYEQRDEFISKFREVNEERKQGMYKDYRFSESWETASLLDQFISVDQIASIR